MRRYGHVVSRLEIHQARGLVRTDRAGSIQRVRRQRQRHRLLLHVTFAGRAV